MSTALRRCVLEGEVERRGNYYRITLTGRAAVKQLRADYERAMEA